MTFEIQTVSDLMSPELEARWAARGAARGDEVFREVLRSFVDEGGPVRAGDLVRRLPGRTVDDVTAALRRLDEQDVVLLDDQAVIIAYPFSAIPNEFAVDLGEGRHRYACCAIDALGLAPMLGRPVGIRSRCHDCGEPLALTVTPDGPDGGEGMLIWFSRRSEGGRVCATL